MTSHPDWVRQIDLELDGELTLAEQAALARHLVTCPACVGARASHTELRLALARSAGQPQARTVPRPAVRARVVAMWVTVSLAAGLVVGWLAHGRWGGPGPGSLEGSRATFVVE